MLCTPGVALGTAICEKLVLNGPPEPPVTLISKCTTGAAFAETAAIPSAAAPTTLPHNNRDACVEYSGMTFSSRECSLFLSCAHGDVMPCSMPRLHRSYFDLL